MLINRRESLLLAFSLFLLFNLAASQNLDGKAPNENKEKASDPMSNLFAELGDFFLDVDQTIAEQSRPKVEREAQITSQLFRPRTDYFDRIQKNYREMQKRLGRLIGNTIGFKNEYSEEELSTVNPPTESFVPTIKPDYNPFAAAAEERKEKLKQKISKGSDHQIFIPKTLDEGFKAFGKLSKSIIDDIGDFNRERSQSKSHGKKISSTKRSGSLHLHEECGNEVLEDPDLEQRRQDRCARIAAEEQARSDLKKLLMEPKRATEALFSKNVDTFDKLTKDILSRSGDAFMGSDQISGFEECGNEVLEDPDLERRRQDRCSRIAAEEQIRSDLKKLLMEPKRATEALFSKNVDTFDKLTKDIIGRSGDVFVENDQILNTDEENSNVETSDKTSNECSEEIIDDEELGSMRKEKCEVIESEERLIRDLNKLLLGSKQSSERLASIGTKAIDDLSSILIRRSGDTEDQNSNTASSDSFDKQVRQLIKDHGSWILDYPLLRRWRQRDRSDDIDISSVPITEEPELTTVESTSDMSEPEQTELYVPVSTDDYEMALARSGEAENPHQSTYYRIVNEDGDVLEEEVDLVLDPESLKSDIEAIEIGRQEPKEIVILAFTTDGVPLKLRLGPEIDNPLQYLHKVLKSAGVSLNIPVESYDDLEPVGKEVLKLGSGILTRAVLINVSNSNELKSLLKALMTSKSSGKTTL